MAFARPTLQTIIDRVETDITSRLTGSVALLKTSLLKILAKVFSAAIHTAYGYLDYISVQLLPDLSTGAWLDRHGLMWGVTRIKATFSQGTIRPSGTNGTVIPAGTIWVRDDGWQYTSDANETISGGIAVCAVTASDAGLNGDVELTGSLTLANPIAGIDDEAPVNTAITGGSDRETDEDYRERILFRIQNPPAGGAERDYVSVGNAVAGVEQTFVFGAQNLLVAEPGHVTCVILGVSPKIPAAGILTDVENALTDADTGIVPVDIEVNNGLHVAPITESDIIIYVQITPNTTAFQTLITANIAQLFTDDGSPGGTILLSRIRNAIATSGVDDYNITDIDVDTVSIGVNDIVLTDFNYPIDDGIVFSLLP